MILNILYIVLAGLGLSFLVFIHELGHYIMARRAKMRVEIFSIGFGKPIYTWMHKGVKWQICFLLFGGYVKIAGMEKENGKEPYEIKDGFYGKRPADRIKVALMGPIVNIVFALIIFTLIWATGGRMKPFEEFTKVIGWMDPASELAENGVKPGDLIETYNGKPFNGFRDLVYNGILSENEIDISGEKIDYATGKEVSYQYDLPSYYIPQMMKGMRTIGILSPASYLIFDSWDQKTGKYSPMYGSEISKGDRIVWANGEFIFSANQLGHIVNQESVFLTILRDGKTLQVRAPRVPIGDLHLTAFQKDEFLDWKRALGLKESVENLYSIPYEIDSLGYVDAKFSYIDSDLIEESNKNQYKANGLDIPLQIGDQIIAVFGEKVTSGLSLFEKMREKKISLIVQKAIDRPLVSWENEDEAFIKSVDWKNLAILANQIGTNAKNLENDHFKVLKPITPISHKEFLDQQKGIHPTDNSFAGQKDFSTKYKYLFLGSRLQDQSVVYNPTPITVFKEVIFETWYTLSSLATGTLSPKWLSGPVGIVKVMHDGWKTGIKEALYWIALISLNLGIINLLPIPVLDGGHISFSIWEMITKKPISSKTMERLVLPFVILLIMFFVYITYQDVSRLFLR